MKYLNRTVIMGMLLVAWFGFVMPFLISHKSYELPAAGMAVTFLGVYLAARSVIKTLNKKETNNENNP
jgi:hypothetical protein